MMMMMKEDASNGTLSTLEHLIDSEEEENEPSSSSSSSLSLSLSKKRSKTKKHDKAEDGRNNGKGIATSLTVIWKIVRCLILDVPLALTFLAYLTSRFMEQVYTIGPLHELIESYRRIDDYDNEGFLTEYDSHMTYYNRQCSREDVTTEDATDLLVNDETVHQAAGIMMTHGAIVIPDLLSKSTSTKLRAYLETRHELHNEGKLSWQEEFWSDIGRLSLGLGVDDADIIGQALEEVGTNEILKESLHQILGDDDPAIVEISTLSALHGADFQGIHTDSDYFGSSLLYSRTFLHSYTLFMALQDTTAQMGATTVCPGSHMCANGDLEHVCLEYNQKYRRHDPTAYGPAFEASSNGKTGRDVGLLHEGSGMMFNQNVWHRGPSNNDPDNVTNRVMFILTFVSRPKYKQYRDVRQQGIGTYYYQRWNMWGHTFQDLSTARTTMRQPYGALRAMGLYDTTDNTGISWWHHFARQLANNEDFYANYELNGFITYLNSNEIQYPKFLLPNDKTFKSRVKKNKSNNTGKSNWEIYLEMMISNLVQFFYKVHWYGIMIYIGIHIILSFISFILNYFVFPRKTTIIKDNPRPPPSSRHHQQEQQSKNDSTVMKFIPSFFIRLLMIHFIVLCCTYSTYKAMERSTINQQISTGEIWDVPFATVPTAKPVLSFSPISPSDEYEQHRQENEGDEMSSSTATYRRRLHPRQPSHTDHEIFEDDVSSSNNGIVTTKTTTVPERMDILIGSRFDGPQLGIYNFVLDYHPGNQRMNHYILPKYVAALQMTKKDNNKNNNNNKSHDNGYFFPSKEFVLNGFMKELLYDPILGVNCRLLQQDFITGDWYIIPNTSTRTTNEDDNQMMKVLRRLLYSYDNLLKERLFVHLNQVLALSRYGHYRESIMYSMYTPHFVNKFHDIIFNENNNDTEQQGKKKKKMKNQNNVVVKSTTTSTKTTTTTTAIPFTTFVPKQQGTTITTKPATVRPMRSFKLIRTKTSVSTGTAIHYQRTLTAMIHDNIKEMTNDIHDDEITKATTKTTELEMMDDTNDKVVLLQVGHRVWAKQPNNRMGTYTMAKIIQIVNDNAVVVEYDSDLKTNQLQVIEERTVEQSSSSSSMKKMKIYNILPYRPYQEGDDVNVLISDEERWYTATIVHAHALGTYDIVYHIDDTSDPFVPKYLLKPVNAERIIYDDDDNEHANGDTDTNLIIRLDTSAIDNTYSPTMNRSSGHHNNDGTGNTFAIGQYVMANFQGAGEWFPGHVVHVHQPPNQQAGAGQQQVAQQQQPPPSSHYYYAIQYTDGDYEHAVPHHMIQIITTPN